MYFWLEPNKLFNKIDISNILLTHVSITQKKDKSNFVVGALGFKLTRVDIQKIAECWKCLKMYIQKYIVSYIVLKPKKTELLEILGPPDIFNLYSNSLASR